MRHVLTMAVGVAARIRIRYYGIALNDGEILMLSSDGLHGVVANEDIETILNRRETTLDEKCRQLISAANEAGSPDNVTVVLVRPGTHSDRAGRDALTPFHPS
jgi:protein phosphatase